MVATRRSVLALGSALAGLSAAAPGLADVPTVAPPRHTFTKPKRLLVLGGTRYLGPAVVRSALGRGHEVTLFNRGKTQSWLFPGLEKLNGNRYPDVGKGLSALRGRDWDVVVDLSGQYPRVVDASTALLQDRAAHYIMVSSISAYSTFRSVGLDEQSPLRALGREYRENPDLVEGDWPTYGARKASGEATVASRFEGRHTIVRPGPICGGENNDGTGAYWAERLFSG